MDELAEILGAPVVRYSTEPVSSAGAGTVAVERVTGTTTAGPFRLVRKRIRPPVGARAAAADDPHHVTYWRREAHAYRSGLLPATGLVAPECVAVHEDPAEIRLWTREVTAPPAYSWPESRYARAGRRTDRVTRVPVRTCVRYSRRS
ncbi:hypothetical protein [Actinocatenispora rupis]|uniref:hypothetical protein n=1 Tax=Actinocatenispora rupis TaxID=519421 RepID=UPI0019456A7E|nr:hypothetical protein [Actinocatenispora rupis]